MVILIALVIALSTTVRKSPKRVAKGFRNLFAWIRGQSSAGERDDEDSDDVDFWEGHVDWRENAYEIPSYNVSTKEGAGEGKGRRRMGDKGERGRTMLRR